MLGRTIIQVQTADIFKLLKKTKEQELHISGLQEVDKDRWQFTVAIQDLQKTKVLLKGAKYDYKIIRHEGILLRLILFLRKKEVLLPILFSLFILYGLANIVWKVSLDQVEPMLQDEVKEELESLGVYKGAWKKTVPDNETIKRVILDKLDTLQYFNIYYEGTTYYVEAEMKDLASPKKEAAYQHLVAAKNGVIEEFSISQGNIVTALHDVVKKGDLLVSGIIEQASDEEDEVALVRAEGEVFATTWYELTVTSPLITEEQSLTGNYFDRYYIQFARYTVPVWGKIKSPFETVEQASETNDVHIFKRKLPFKLVKERNYESRQVSNLQTEKVTRDKILRYIEGHLHSKLGKNVQIKKYYVLHEKVHNGKVNMNLYISVRENIAEAKPIQK